MTNSNKGSNSTKAGEHSRLNRENDLWRGGKSRRREPLVRWIPYEQVDHRVGT